MSTSVYSYLNQIFYKHNKFDDASTIGDLEKWMLFQESLRVDAPVDLKPVSTESVVSPVDFSPVKQDSLFWCAYTVHHGEAEYWAIGNKYKNVELTEKQKIIDYIRHDSAHFKRCFGKMSNVGIQEIMAELMIDKKTSWKTFYALCAYYKFRAIVVYEKTYLEFSPIHDQCVDTYLFNRTKDGHISVSSMPLTPERILEIKTGKMCLDQNPDKPLKAASNYKVDDLIEMAENIGVDIKQGLYNKWKKSDWYESISNHCKW